MTPQIKREMRRRAAIEPVIGHLKEDHRMDRNYLAHRHGDFNNAILAAAGYNFRRLITGGSAFYCASSWPYSSLRQMPGQREKAILRGRRFQQCQKRAAAAKAVRAVLSCTLSLDAPDVFCIKTFSCHFQVIVGL